MIRVCDGNDWMAPRDGLRPAGERRRPMDGRFGVRPDPGWFADVTR